VNAQDASGDTALHGAAQIRADATVQFLVEQGAAISTRNANGETPLTYAERILVLQGATLNGQRSSTGDLLRTLGAR
jgi:ankyrin repeat protein